MATPIGDAVPLSGNPSIDGLTQGARWQFEAAPVLSYSFSVETEFDFVWNAALQDAVRRAFAGWSDVANLSFSEIAPGSNIDFSPADIALAPWGTLLGQIFSEAKLTALGLFPDPAAADAYLAGFDNNREDYPNPEGDVYFDHLTAPFSSGNVAPGGVGGAIFIHEIGHALGLKHPMDGTQGDHPAVAALDNTRLTVMRIEGFTSTPGTGFPVTPLLEDIRAIQYIYGANNSFHTGDDTYFLRADGMRRAIWDAGGNDTFDASFAPAGLVIHLAEASLIDILANSTVAIAYGVTIENAIGSAFADRIEGNAGDNLLEGRGGADTLEGAGGSDTLVGGAGADTLNGGAGDDSYVVDALDVLVDAGGTADTVIASLSYSIAAHAAIENMLAAGAAPINLTGNALDNVLSGNAGNNVLDGGAGNDTLVGGAGDDTYIVDSVDDVLLEVPGEGSDTIVAPFAMVLDAPFENLFLSGTASVNATGNAAGNLLRGNAGNNVLDGGAGVDTMEGGAGNDTYLIDRPVEQTLISDSGGIDTVVSSAKYAGLSAGIENLTLAGRAWIGFGNDAANVITGNARANILIGGAGSDTLVGGDGADILDGGAGADRFVFDTAPGGRNVDEIVDFSAAQGDRIVLDDDIYAAAVFGVNILLDPGGGLYYDADGAGGAAAIQFAILGSTAGIGAASFEIVD